MDWTRSWVFFVAVAFLIYTIAGGYGSAWMALLRGPVSGAGVAGGGATAAPGTLAGALVPNVQSPLSASPGVGQGMPPTLQYGGTGVNPGELANAYQSAGGQP